MGEKQAPRGDVGQAGGSSKEDAPTGDRYQRQVYKQHLCSSIPLQVTQQRRPCDAKLYILLLLGPYASQSVPMHIYP